MSRRDRSAETKPGRQGLLTALALVAACAGLIVVAVAVEAQQSAPEPSTPVLGSIPSPTPADATPADGNSTAKSDAHTLPPHHGPRQRASVTPSRPSTALAHRSASARGHKSTRRADRALVLPAARPVHLAIPAIGVDTDLTTVGLTSDRAIDVPHGAEINEAAWFRQSPAPGQYGPAVIVGHIDTVDGPSVFFRLGGLKPGDQVRIRRADFRTAVFTIDGLAQYPNRTKLPIQAIYGGDVDRAELRLMTCSNFDSSIGHYQGNTVVFAHLTRIQQH